MTQQAAKHVMVLSPTPTHPQDAGNRKRIFEVCNALKQLGAIIHFVYVPREWVDTCPHQHYRGMADHWDYFHIVPPAQPAVYRTSDDYFELDAWWDVAIEHMINWKRRTQKFDMVIVHYLFFSKALTLFSRDTVKVLDTHDVMSDRQRLLDANNIEREFFYTTPDREKAGLNRADLVLAIKDSEAARFTQLTDKPLLVLGHKEPRRFIRGPFQGPRVLGMIGSANSINRENFTRFFDEVARRIPADRPEFRIDLAGHVCSMMDTSPYPFVKWLGPVADVTDFYGRLDMALLPFDFSTGLKIKTVEALSFGLPVVGTANAFDGLTACVPEHRCATIGEMADLVIDYILRPRRLDHLAEAGCVTFDAYTATVDRAINALYDVAVSAGIATTPAVPMLQNAGVDASTVVIASDTAFWQPKSLGELRLARLVQQFRYGCHVEYLFDGRLDDDDKQLLYRRGLVDHVHELQRDSEGRLACPPPIADQLMTKGCRALVADGARLLGLYETWSAPSAVIVFDGRLQSIAERDRPVTGLVCNQRYELALASRLFRRECILVAPYLPFSERQPPRPENASMPGQVVIGIGAQSAHGSPPSLQRLIEGLVVYQRFGGLQLRLLGGSIGRRADVPIASYAVTDTIDFMTGLFAYLALPAVPDGPDPLIPDMLLAGIPVIVSRCLADLMDETYSGHLVVVDSEDEAMGALVALVASGAMPDDMPGRELQALPTIGVWQRDLALWLEALSAAR